MGASLRSRLIREPDHAFHSVLRRLRRGPRAGRLLAGARRQGQGRRQGAASDIKDAAHTIANDPDVKEAGAAIKESAKDTAADLKEAAGEATDKAQDLGEKAGDKAKEAGADLKRDAKKGAAESKKQLNEATK